MRATGAKLFTFISENMPKKPKIDQNQTKICLISPLTRKGPPQAKIFWVSHMKITSKPLKLIFLCNLGEGGRMILRPPPFWSVGPLATPLCKLIFFLKFLWINTFTFEIDSSYINLIDCFLKILYDFL